MAGRQAEPSHSQAGTVIAGLTPVNNPGRFCAGRFPTHDFQAYHESGLDEHGFFDPDHADRSLLFNSHKHIKHIGVTRRGSRAAGIWAVAFCASV